MVVDYQWQAFEGYACFSISWSIVTEGLPSRASATMCEEAPSLTPMSSLLGWTESMRP